MKESEAKEKECPAFSIMAAITVQTCIQSYMQSPKSDETEKATDAAVKKAEKETYCKGSACMMWQWLGDKSGGWCGLTNTGYGGIE